MIMTTCQIRVGRVFVIVEAFHLEGVWSATSGLNSPNSQSSTIKRAKGGPARVVEGERRPTPGTLRQRDCFFDD